MLNESLLSLSLDDLKNIALYDLTVLHVSLAYILVYVVYKALGRYIYFKPQEHASKINRTFLALSLLAVSLHFVSIFTSYLPVLPEYRWLYALCVLTLLAAPLSILMDRIVWRYGKWGYKTRRFSDYMPIQPDYNKTTILQHKSEGSNTRTWEEEGVESTEENLHSDALLNMLALIVFIVVCVKGARESIVDYGLYSIALSFIIILWIATLFFDRGVFSWVVYLERKFRRK